MPQEGASGSDASEFTLFRANEHFCGMNAALHDTALQHGSNMHPRPASLPFPPLPHCAHAPCPD